MRNSLRSIIKLILRWITGKCELERLTFSDSRNLATIQAVRHSLLLSITLPIVRLRTVVQTDEFDAQSIHVAIVHQKHFSNTGLWFVVTSMRRTNVALSEIRRLGNTSFDETRHEPLLRGMWKALRPSKEYKRKDGQWSEVGFQGVDPATDLRGSGILSLENLFYFATQQADVARRILDEHCADVVNGGFPFAVTGINITFFLLDLCIRLRAMDDLFVFLDHVSGSPPPLSSLQTGTQTNGTPQTLPPNETTPLLQDRNIPIDAWQDETIHLDVETRTQALERFNVAYCYVFVLFARRWMEAHPSSAMEFQNVFKPFKLEVTAHAMDIMSGRVHNW